MSERRRKRGIVSVSVIVSEREGVSVNVNERQDLTEREGK